MEVLFIALAFGAAAFLLQAPLLRAMQGRLHGDEQTYVERALRRGVYEEDRFTPVPFLRMPLMIWLLVPALGRAGNVLRARWLASTIGAAVVVVTVVLASDLGGVQSALTAGILLLLLVERAVFAVTMWPDSLLALCTVSSVLLLRAADEPRASMLVALGVLAMLAVATRVDGAVLGVAVTAALIDRGAPPAAAVLVVIPTVFFLLAWAVRSKRRYGVFVPENTVAFNLALASAESRGAHRSVEDAIGQTYQGWRREDVGAQLRSVRESVGEIVSHPGATALAVLRRALSLLGPDTFTAERLMAPDGSLGRLAGVRRGWLLHSVWWGVPVLVGFVLSSLLVQWILGYDLVPSGWGDGYLWPYLAYFSVLSAVHTRTRYRTVILPVFALLGAQAAGVLSDLAQTSTAAITFALALGALLAFLLGRFPARREAP